MYFTTAVNPHSALYCYFMSFYIYEDQQNRNIANLYPDLFFPLAPVFLVFRII